MQGVYIHVRYPGFWQWIHCSVQPALRVCVPVDIKSMLCSFIRALHVHYPTL